MSGFDRRREGYEAKFAMDEEQRFRATVRRDKAVGLWAAARLGLTGAAAEEYALSVAKADLREPGDDDLIAKVLADFAAKGVALDAAAIRAELDAQMLIAARAVTESKG